MGTYITHILQSCVDMYVDDIIGAYFDEDLRSDLVHSRRVCTDLLGPTAVADDNTEWGRRVDIIGYVIALDRKRVSISRKIFLNTLYGFLLVDLDAAMSFKTAQRLASWSSRYGMVCRAMRPFCGALHRLSAGRTDRHATFTPSEEAKRAIRLWRAMLFLVRYDELRFTRSLESFDDTSPNLVIEFDASLACAGIQWFRRVNGAEVCLGGSGVDLRFLGFKDDSVFQNLCEFLGKILGIIGLVELGNLDEDVEIRGDSVTALAWAETERYRGEREGNASTVFTTLCLSSGLDVKTASHIAGINYIRCDELSRLASSGRLVGATMKRHDLEVAVEVNLGGDAAVQKLLALCNPALSFSGGAFHRLLGRSERDLNCQCSISLPDT